MSRYIDLAKPITDEDRKYLQDRGHYRTIRVNDAEFRRGSSPIPEGEPSGSGSSPLEPEQPVGAAVSEGGNTPEEVEWVQSLTDGQLKAELKKEGQPVSGKTADLQARLLSVLAGAQD